MGRIRPDSGPISSFLRSKRTLFTEIHGNTKRGLRLILVEEMITKKIQVIENATSGCVVSFNEQG